MVNSGCFSGIYWRLPMKLVLSLLAVFGFPALAWSEGGAPSPARMPAPSAPSVQTAPAAAVPPAVQPSPTPSVDLKHAPKIFSAKPNFDFKNVDEGPDIIHEFRIVNKGNRPLTITNVGTSCGCTAAVLKKVGSKKDEAATLPVEIPAGGKGTIKATYHTSGRPGHATKIITISSNDPVNAAYQLKLDMTVVRDIDVQPDRVYLYGIHYKQPHETTVTVKGKPDMPLSILSVESVNKVVSVTSVSPILNDPDKREGVTIVVNLPVTQAIGTFTDEILVKTDNPKKPEVRIQVLGEVTGRVQFNPKNFTFTPNQEAPVTVQFTVDPPKGFEVRGVESTKHLTRPYIKKTRGGNGLDLYSLIVSVVKNLPKDSDGKDQIIVRTNDPDQEKIFFDVQAQK